MPKPSKQQISNRHGGMTTESIATPASLLVEYAALRYDYSEVSEAHRRHMQDAAVDIRRKYTRVMGDLLAIGRRLLEVKDFLPHGEFGRWIETEFELPERTVQGMMNAARIYSDEARVQRVARLSERAIYMLAAPSTPEEAREAVERIMEETGKVLTIAEVHQVIDEAKARNCALLEAPTTPAPAPRMIEMRAETPAVENPSEPKLSHHEMVLRDIDRYEATAKAEILGETAAESEPIMPADLAEAGFVLAHVGFGEWVAENDSIGYVGNRVTEPAAAIEEARECLTDMRAMKRAGEDVEEWAKSGPFAIQPPNTPSADLLNSATKNQQATIDAEYAVVTAPAPDSFDAWLSLRPANLTLRQRLAIIELAKRVAVDARDAEPRLYYAVNNALPMWSQLIITMEKMLK